MKKVYVIFLVLAFIFLVIFVFNQLGIGSMHKPMYTPFPDANSSDLRKTEEIFLGESE
ncbi:hypothetical protein ACFLY2_01545 [Patescibacteria group bacterium]